MPTLRWTVAGLATSCMLILGQEKVPAPNVPVQMVVTVEARHDKKEVPVLNREDVMAFQKHERLQVTDLVPCRGDHAALELFILIDDASGMSLGSQLDDLRQFIETQPAATSIGVGYMRNAAVDVAQDLTADHPKVAKALRLPLGSPGVMPSPFLALSDLIKRWPTSPARHEVLLVSERH